MKRIVARVQALPSRWYILALIVLGTAVRFWDIARSSIWHDEGFTLMLAPQSLGQIVARTARDVHPPLYYFTLHYWMLLFGRSETAVRGLSAVFMIAAIPVAYLLLRRLFSESAARLGALMLTFGPYTIRFAQETRMYGMVAFLLLLATYFLVRALEDNRWKWWLIYSAMITAALYTHYFTAFVILTHAIYVATKSRRGAKTGLWNIRWWLANTAALVLFLPWLPTAYRQFTRINDTFWIPHVTAATLPDTIAQFLTFTDADPVPVAIRVVVALAVAAFVGYIITISHRYRRNLAFLTLYASLGPILVFIVSLSRPVFVDRYFLFAAIAFYCLIGVLIVECWPMRGHLRTQAAVTATVLVLFAIGVYDIHFQVDHQMRVIGKDVSQQYQPGDIVMAGEIYTYFDFTYYNHTGQPLKLLAPYGLSGYGESSLLYDQANQIVVHNYTDLHPASGYVWIIGKTKNPEYFQEVPPQWKQVEYLEAGYIVAKKYRVNP